MRNIERIFVHCTATQSDASVKSIRNHFRLLGWKSPGYHYLIDAAGHVHELLHPEKVANGVKGYNATAVHVAYIGGIASSGAPEDTRTAAQRSALRVLLGKLRQWFPYAEILGHRDISPDLNGNGILELTEFIKMCPCFDAKKEYADI